MGTIIEFPADAASRRPGPTMDGAPREGRWVRGSRLPLAGPAALGPGWEGRVGGFPGVPLAGGEEGGFRPPRLWPHFDRRAAPLAHLALCATDGRRSRRHHAVRAVF